MTTRQPEVTVDRTVTVIRLGPGFESIEEPEIASLEQVLVGIVDDAQPPKIVVDLAHTKFFGSSFMEVLFHMWNRIKQRDGQFALSSLTEYCDEVLRITHLDRLWDIHDNPESAVDSITG